MTPVQRRLVGVGLGPGDPELITIKAAESLRAADVVICPDAKYGRAQRLVAEVAPDAKTLRVEFSMSRDLAARQTSRDEAARAVSQAFADGAHLVVFATVGDPAVYSTFAYIADQVAAEWEAEVSTVPGITAMQLIAAAAGQPLTLGQDVLALVPATAGPERLREVAQVADSVVVYKGGRQIGEISDELRSQGFEVTIASDLGTPEAQLRTGDELAGPLGYFTTLLARRPQ